MDRPPQDPSVLAHIQKLADEEHRLLHHKNRTDADHRRLEALKVELDQCWDLLRQRRALRAAGQSPDGARVRPPGIVENYEG